MTREYGEDYHRCAAGSTDEANLPRSKAESFPVERSICEHKPKRNPEERLESQHRSGVAAHPT